MAETTNCFSKISNQSKHHKDRLKLTLRLYEFTSLPRDGVDVIIQMFDQYISESLFDDIKDKMESAFNNIGASQHVKNTAKVVLHNSKNPFKNFDSEQKRFTLYKRESFFVEPQEFIVGWRKNILSAESKVSIPVEIPITAVFLPLDVQLKIFLEIPGVYDEIIKYKRKLFDEYEENKIVSNFIQGRLWREKYAGIKDTHEPLFVFFDDFETSNSLGSHSGSQKFGGVYVSLPTLPPHLRSKMSNIFVSTLFYSDHRKEFGNESVFKKVIEALNDLKKNGITLNLGPGRQVKVFFQCVLICGDNLGVNQCCGFTGGFRGTYTCRICTMPSSHTKFATKENTSLLRNRENYEEHVITSSFGVKERCVFNVLDDHHIAENKYCDFMHDMDEGTACYTVEWVLTYLIFIDKVIDLKTVNDCIEKFNYTELESGNKPRPLFTEPCDDINGFGIKKK